MIVYRIAKAKHIKDLSGIGAKLHGGRWNHKGIAMIYTSESRALATLEYRVHIPYPIVPSKYRIATLEISNRIIPEEIPKSKLPMNWQEYPAPSGID